MTSAMAIAKVRLATFLHSRFRFLLCSSLWLKTLLAQHTSHASSSLSTQTENLNFPVNHILQVSCDWMLCYDWYALHGAGRQTALWPCPRPFPSVRNRVLPRETSLMDGDIAYIFIIFKKAKITRWAWIEEVTAEMPGSLFHGMEQNTWKTEQLCKSSLQCPSPHAVYHQINLNKHYMLVPSNNITSM